MSKVRVSLWLNGPPSDQQGTIHGTLKKFTCADLATEMDPSTITYREITSDESNPLWKVNDKEIRMFSMDIDPTQLDYVLTAGCQPIIDIGANATQVGEDEYDLAYASGGTFRNAGLTAQPADWYVCGHTKYYVKTVVPDSINEVTWNCYKPVGWTETSSQYSPISFDTAHPEKYYVTDAPAAIDIYFNSAAHFGIGAYNEAEVLGAYDSCSIRRFFGPNMYNWRLTYPTLSGSSPGYWNAYWDLGNGYPGTRVFGAADLTDVLDGSYATRYKYYAFAHQYDPDNTGTPETYIGFLFTTENALGQVTSASALIMSQDIASGVIKTPDGGEISGVEGGNPNWDEDSDNRDPEDDDDVITNWNGKAGIFMPGYHRYVLSTAHSGQFAAFTTNLWNPSLWQSFINTVFKPIEAVITCHVMPTQLAPPATQTLSPIIVAGNDMSDGVSVPTFGSDADIAKYEFPTVNIPLRFDGFADFTNTAVYIHLPYIGTKPIDLSQCMGGSISVVYYSEVFSGDCCAWVYVSDKDGNGRNLYEFKGNCSKEIPLTSRPSWLANALSFAGMITPPMASGVKAAVGIGASSIMAGGEFAPVFSESIAGGAGVVETFRGLSADWGVLSGAARNSYGAMSDTVSSTLGGFGPAINKISEGMSSVGAAAGAGKGTLNSNGAGGNVTTPTDNHCYLIIERPVWNNPLNYAQLFGLPSDVGGTINASSENAPFEGFLSVRQIELVGIQATVEERDEITALMQAGVYVS